MYFFYPINLQHLSSKHVFSIRMKNSMDPDQMASAEANDLDLQCFQKRINPGSAGQGLIRILQNHKLWFSKSQLSCYSHVNFE